MLSFQRAAAVAVAKHVLAGGSGRRSLVSGRLRRLVVFVASSRVVVRRRFFSTMAGDKKPFERLPTHVVPANYSIRLKPNLDAFTFEGYEEITVQVRCCPSLPWKYRATTEGCWRSGGGARRSTTSTFWVPAGLDPVLLVCSSGMLPLCHLPAHCVLPYAILWINTKGLYRSYFTHSAHYQHATYHPIIW